MRKNRYALLIVSGAIVVGLLGGSVVARMGRGDGSYGQALLFAEAFSLIVDNYVDPVDQERLLRGGLTGMLTGLDAQGAYLTAEEAGRFRESPGVGPADPGLSVIKGYGALVIVGVEDGSPAAAAGLEPGDQIRRIEEQSLRDLSLLQAMRLLRGEPDTTVKLGVLRVREGFRREELNLRRTERRNPAHSVEVRQTVVVLRVRDLSRVVRDAVARDLERAGGGGAGRLLLDVRNATEGSPRDAVRLAALFTSGDLLVLKDASGATVETLATTGPPPVWEGRVAVLANGGTASGAEALVRILQDRKGAPVYGEGTYGLGAEPRLFDLPGGSALLLSSLVWTTMDGGTWHEVGVTPDRPLRSTARADEVEEDLLRMAVEDFATAVPKAPAEKAA